MVHIFINTEIESKEVEELIRFSMRQLQTFENSVEERLAVCLAIN